MPTKALRCPSCAAPVRSGDPSCAHCGSQLATVACPSCLALVPLEAPHCPQCGAAVGARSPAASGDLACPECRRGLASSTVGEVGLNPCGSCGGVWLRHESFAHLVRDHEGRDVFIQTLSPEAPSPAPPGLQGVRYRPCPSCGKFMNRTNYARVSGVVVDLCKEHGLWFDRDELRLVLLFIDGGGLAKAAERQRFDLEQERARMKEASRELARAQGGRAWEPHTLDSLGDDLEAGRLLGDILAGAAETLWHRLRG